MGYKGSYIWKLRQGVGSMRLLTVTVDIVPINSEGKVKLVYAPHVNGWSCVGGHAEYGDSWSSAAVHELEEEAGLVAREEDLIPFGAISGPERIFHYADGEAQPFTLCFTVKNWQEEKEQTDLEEIPENGWFTFEEAFQMPITPWCRHILEGYLEYMKTGQFQMIEDTRS